MQFLHLGFKFDINVAYQEGEKIFYNAMCDYGKTLIGIGGKDFITDNVDSLKMVCKERASEYLLMRKTLVANG